MLALIIQKSIQKAPLQFTNSQFKKKLKNTTLYHNQCWHCKSGNQFKIVLRDFKVDPEHLTQRLTLIQQHGIPNYFAEQRFGHDSGNLHRAQQLIESDQLKGNRHGTGIYLSAARSWLFNIVLAEHIERGHGSVTGNGTGALWGRGRSNASIEENALEDSVLADWQDWR